jgi:cell division protein FtsW
VIRHDRAAAPKTGDENRTPRPEHHRARSTAGGRDRPKPRRLNLWPGPLQDFHTLLTLTTLMVALGLMMVLSASTVEAYRNFGSAYARFLPQLAYAAVGAVCVIVIVRIPTRWIRRSANYLLIAAFALLLAVLIPGIGVEQMGAQSWIFIGSVSFQPSELAKIALAVWAAHIVSQHIGPRAQRSMSVFKGVSLVSVAVLALIVLQKDLGTAITVGIIFLALLWFGGFPARLFAAMTAGLVVTFAILMITAAYRSDRLRAYLNPNLDPAGLNYQTTQARYALADGGFFGVGLGQSDSKWSYLPQAYNDFIFAIIGEELGLIGALIVVAMFAGIVYFGLRVAARNSDPFLKIIAGVSTTWIVLQAWINIGYVVGLLPVTGLQLPLISAGGTSMITTMVMFGLLLHAAYREPHALASHSSAPIRTRMHRVFGNPTSEPDLSQGRRRRPEPTRSQRRPPQRVQYPPRTPAPTLNRRTSTSRRKSSRRVHDASR